MTRPGERAKGLWLQMISQFCVLRTLIHDIATGKKDRAYKKGRPAEAFFQNVGWIGHKIYLAEVLECLFADNKKEGTDCVLILLRIYHETSFD